MTPKTQLKIELMARQLFLKRDEDGSLTLDDELMVDFIQSKIETSYQQGVEDMRRKCVEEVEKLHGEYPMEYDDAVKDATNLINNVK